MKQACKIVLAKYFSILLVLFLAVACNQETMETPIVGTGAVFRCEDKQLGITWELTFNSSPSLQLKATTSLGGTHGVIFHTGIRNDKFMINSGMFTLPALMSLNGTNEYFRFLEGTLHRSTDLTLSFRHQIEGGEWEGKRVYAFSRKR